MVARRLLLFAAGLLCGVLVQRYGEALYGSLDGEGSLSILRGLTRDTAHMGTCRGCKRVKSPALKNGTVAGATAGTFASASSVVTRGGAASHAVSVSRILVMVITGEAHHQDRVEAILDTWGRWLPRERLLFISDAANDTLGTIRAPHTQGGHGPSQRKWFYGVLAAANASRNGLPADWFVVADDDTFLLVPNLLEFLGRHDPSKPAYFGQVCSQNCAGPCVCGGGGWAASAPLFLRMADDFDSYGTWPPPCCKGMYYSDQIISRYLNDVQRVPLTDSKEWASQPPDFYITQWQGRTDKPRGFGRAVTFHYLGKYSCVTTRVLYALAIAMFPDDDGAGGPPK
jgi:hypothetical protein